MKMVENNIKDLDPHSMSNEEARIRLELACNDYIKEPNKDALNFIAHNSHNFSVLDFVQLLQSHITSKEDDVRLNAVTLLIEVTSQSSISDSEVSVLIQFLCGRLSDKYNIIPTVLSGVSRFVKERELEAAVVCTVARQLFASVDVQALHQDTRFKAYTLVNDLLQRNLLSLIEGMGTKFVVNYINLVDGEQDPRNLMLIFNMTVMVLQHFDIDGIEETMFDVISCYYPVDFSPPTDMEVPVTPEDLRDRLNNCFKASIKLVPLAIPFLSEKFNSSLLQTRVQSCETLKMCLTSYGTSCTVDHVTLIWNDMKKEIFGGINKELRDRCLEVISALFWVLTIPNVKNQALDPANFLVTVFDYCKEKMTYSEAKYLRPTALILVSVVKSSGLGSGLIAESCLEWFCDRFKSTDDESVKPILLDELVTCISEMQVEPARANAAVHFFEWETLQNTFLDVIEDCNLAELHSTALCGISELLNIYHLTEQQKLDTSPLDIQKIVLDVYNLMMTSDIDEGLQILVFISREYPDLVNDLLLEKLLLKVDEGDSSARKMLSRLLIGPLLVRHSPRLLKLFTVDHDYQILSLLTVSLSYQESPEVIQFCQEFLFHQILNFLIQMAIKDVEIEQAVLFFQEFTVTLYKNRFPRTVDMAEFGELFTFSSVFKPFSCASPPQQTMLTAIYSSVLMYGSLESTFDANMTPVDPVPLVKLLVTSSDPITIRSLSTAIGLMLNRLDEGSKLDDLKSLVFQELEQCTLVNNKVWLCIRMCQGLVLRWEDSAPTAVQTYVECLINRQTHKHTSDLTPHILEPIYQGNRMVLYKQRFLLTLIPLITPFINNSSELPGEVSLSLVQAVGSLLQLLPQSLISTHGDTLYPVILNNLAPRSCSTSTLTLIRYLISTTPGVVFMHLDTLVARLTSLCRSGTDAVRGGTDAVGSGTDAAGSAAVCNAHVRIEALRTLRDCTIRLHHKHTHMHREFVVKALKTVLRDKKRIVRQAASETIQSWIMMQP